MGPPPDTPATSGSVSGRRVLEEGPAVVSSEDCNFLNIWAPGGPPPSRPTRAVMVFLHGGGMMVGSGNDQNGTALAAKHGAVVVTANYRLGAFGLLPMHDDV